MKTMQLKTNSSNQHILEEFATRYQASGCKNAVDFIGVLMEGAGKVSVPADYHVVVAQLTSTIAQQQQVITSQQQALADLSRPSTELVAEMIADLQQTIQQVADHSNLNSEEEIADHSRPTEVVADLGRPSAELVETIKAGFEGSLEYLAESEGFNITNHLTRDDFLSKYPEQFLDAEGNLNSQEYSIASSQAKESGYSTPDGLTWFVYGKGKSAKWYQKKPSTI